MRIIIFSDIHGNLPAFELMLKDVDQVDQYISLGDVVNYGPWSNECVQLLETLPNCIKLMGNHDQSFINKTFPNDKPLIKVFSNFCLSGFNQFAILKKYKKNYRNYGFKFAHTINNLRLYEDSAVSISGNWVIGHSHHQFKIKNNGYNLINVGSIGQNRKYINVINYVIYDTVRGEFILKSIIYDIDKVISEMKIKKFPQICLDYYLQKDRF